ncbi:UNVERIFIED_CONTAM: hypothetical protein Sradi_3875000 [Sesamum radiatum]|uniref:Myb/SANT-like domain-containing protein n=1 Tax=Sesamum radiatum TaxID=300843 RepID=A0AAW2Q2U7_SESRA
MDTDGSIGGRRRGAKIYGKASRHIWSTVEEEALLECLRDIVRFGWKCDNGFRTGYLTMLEQLLKKKYPESGLKSDPHISSKIHVWKKTYACISDMLAKSGFGWNESMQMIAVSDEVFDNYDKIDPFAKTLRFKSFPYYPAWSEIFGKDRATGEHAEDIYNASNNVSIEGLTVSPEYYVPSSDINALADDHDFMNSFTQSTVHLNAAPSDTERVSSKKRKKSISTVDEKFDAKFDTFVSVTDNRLGDLAKRFGVEQENQMLGVRSGELLNLCLI